MQRSPTILIVLLVAPAGCALIADLPDVELAPGASGSVYAATILQDQPVAYWRLGETGGDRAIDASGNGRDGTYQASPYLGATGAIADDTAVRFDGMLAHVDAGDVLSFPGNAKFTLEAWMQPDEAKVMFIAGKLAWDGVTQQGYGIVVDPSLPASALSAFRNSDNDQALTGWVGGGTIEVGTFYHVAVTYDGGLISLFLDGAKLGSNVASDPIGSPAYPFKIAIAQNFVSFAGTIDEVAVYDKALSADRILAHYQTGVESNDP